MLKRPFPREEQKELSWQAHEDLHRPFPTAHYRVHCDGLSLRWSELLRPALYYVCMYKERLFGSLAFSWCLVIPSRDGRNVSG